LGLRRSHSKFPHLGILLKTEIEDIFMSNQAKDLGLDKLPTEDKVALINELWVDVVASERSSPMDPELAEKLDRRVAEYEANPNGLHTVDEVMATLKADRDA